jgi:hypothetical protein
MQVLPTNPKLPRDHLEETHFLLKSKITQKHSSTEPLSYENVHIQRKSPDNKIGTLKPTPN